MRQLLRKDLGQLLRQDTEVMRQPSWVERYARWSINSGMTWKLADKIHSYILTCTHTMLLQRVYVELRLALEILPDGRSHWHD